MSTEIRMACIVAVLAAACGGANTKAHRVEQPTLEQVSQAETGDASAGTSLGAQVAPGFLRACQTRAQGAGLVELTCDDHQIVEFRKLEIGAQAGGDSDLDELLKILGARFGTLEEERDNASIDELVVRLSRFKTVEPGLQGLAITIDNSEGHYWGLACYRKGGPVNESFCGDAIASAARAGGLAHVEAKAMKQFAEGKLVVPEGCESTSGRGISCSSGKLSWSATDMPAEVLRDETIANLKAMAKEEGVVFEPNERSCTLLGKAAQCRWLRLRNEKKSEELHFVLAIGGEQERLVVCTFPGPFSASSPLPKPCAQALVILDI